MTKLKICGLRGLSHALAAAEAGADFLGFVFVPGVRRQLLEDKAQEIIREFHQLKGDQGPKLVGLFSNQPLDEINRIIEYCGLDMAQLCGDEPPEYWQEVNRPIIKQVKVRDSNPREEAIARVMEEADKIVTSGQICLLDRYEEGVQGGSGLPFDWGTAAEVAKHHSFLLAGGLRPSNVVEAISTVHPWGVDVSSGVETKGTKDVEKIQAFARAVLKAGPS